MEVSAKSLRSRVGDVLSRLDRGESVTITYRGKPRARLVGIEAGGRRPRAAPIPFPPSACGVIAMTRSMWTPMFEGCAKDVGMLIDTDMLI